MIRRWKAGRIHAAAEADDLLQKPDGNWLLLTAGNIPQKLASIWLLLTAGNLLQKTHGKHPSACCK